MQQLAKASGQNKVRFLSPAIEIQQKGGEKLTSPFTITKEQAERFAEQIKYGKSLSFSNMANRNWVAKICRQKGIKVWKSSTGYQVVSEHYVADLFEPDRGLANNNFGGKLYKLTAERNLW